MFHWRSPTFYLLMVVGWFVAFVMSLPVAGLFLSTDAWRSPTFIATMQVPSLLFGYVLARVCLPKPRSRGFPVAVAGALADKHEPVPPGEGSVDNR